MGMLHFMAYEIIPEYNWVGFHPQYYPTKRGEMITADLVKSHQQRQRHRPVETRLTAADDCTAQDGVEVQVMILRTKIFVKMDDLEGESWWMVPW